MSTVTNGGAFSVAGRLERLFATTNLTLSRFFELQKEMGVNISVGRSKLFKIFPKLSNDDGDALKGLVGRIEQLVLAVRPFHVPFENMTLVVDMLKLIELTGATFDARLEGSESEQEMSNGIPTK